MATNIVELLLEVHRASDVDVAVRIADEIQTQLDEMYDRGIQDGNEAEYNRIHRGHEEGLEEGQELMPDHFDTIVEAITAFKLQDWDGLRERLMMTTALMGNEVFIKSPKNLWN